ncbi:zinc ribbon domain-containing protein [Microbacterium yannicii]|uniref:zinc ribbon domain-containing protein n=1 Tax=Microbacterium yannicii TaxID=671622 RepID=UPI000310D4C1|nr:zinc ribbon domain-containing protein [Microbacterium yannicii]
MAERICGVCGTRNDADARFCKNCDSYLGWDVGASTLDGEALTGTIPTVVGMVPAEPAPIPGAAGSTATRAPETPDSVAATAEVAAAGRSSADLAQPARGSLTVTAEEPEVVVTPDAPADVAFTIENTLTIVDGYVLEALDPPSWLAVAHPDVHLMPGEVGSVALSVGLRDDTMVVAQRVPLTVVVRSMEDPERNAAVSVVVTVPPHGPRPTLEARPTLIRLDGAGSGEFSVRLDNRAANYPQTVGMGGGDPEGVVSFVFTPDVVEVPAGAMVEVPVSFTAPQPAPGQQLNRQLTVTATNDEESITTTLTLVQSTAAAPADAPIRVQVEPSSIRLIDATEADFEVHVDNRGGHSGVTVVLSGRDPERRLSFAFAPARFVAAAGQVTRAHGRVRANLPPHGSSESHPFTVIASDGTTDVETSASLEIATSAGAMATAEVRAHPEKLDIGKRGEGEFSIEVDNRRSAQPLNVVLAGRSDDGLVRTRFTPPRLTVAPGSVGHARMSVSSPHPRPREIGVRRIAVLVSDGTQRLTASAELMQTGPDRRRPAGRWLVVLGALMVLVGALKWTPDMHFLFAAVDVNSLTGSDDPLSDGITAAETPLRIALALLGVGMLFGLAGKGGLTRKSAILAVLLSVAYIVSGRFTDATLTGLGFGIPVVVAGAVLAYIGEILLRPPD